MNEYENNFAAFILSHKRPDNVITIKSLRRCGYTGKIYVIIDDLDDTKEQYINNFGSDVIIFDKMEYIKKTDTGDNFKGHGTVAYARNACFDIARNLGLQYFLVLDDDYTCFRYRFNDLCLYGPKKLRNLDSVLKSVLKFLIASNCHSIALSQGGDFIGGSKSALATRVKLKRKAMNSFFCNVDRPFQIIGRMNDDVNTYVYNGSIGKLFFTVNQVCLEQMQTQKNKGGLTEMYLEHGTYVKSFYTVLYQPSSVSIRIMGGCAYPRFHHFISWKHTVPKILRESLKKGS
jgi:hypothetical protein